MELNFRKYQHVERYGNSEVNGIEIGKLFVFPKIDGTNSSLWLHNGELKAGSRNRELTLEKDNQGFYKYALSQEKYKQYLLKHPNHRLYGEWLVPHSLKTYREDAWKKLYIFDVISENEDGSFEYLSYDTYKPLLEEFNIEYIPPIVTIINGTYDNFIKLLDKNTFLIKDGKGIGEGIVIKNYEYKNKYHSVVWAKIITNEFKEKHQKVMGHNQTIDNQNLIEENILNDFCTNAFIEKEYAKIINEKGEWKNQYIPMLLNKIYHELISEEMWHIVKKYKNPKINFKLLNNLVTNKIKIVKADIF